MSGPRLLDKKTINAEVATQKKQQIDSGIVLAKKVDAVRESLETETKNLDEFRTNTTAIVQAEVAAAIHQRDNLKDEIVVLERRKTEALMPITMEWEILKHAQGQFQKDKDAWGEKSDSLDVRESQLERKEQEIENEMGRATGLKHQASEALAAADSILTNAREASAEMRNKAQVVLSAAEAKEREVNLKESEIEEREAIIERTKERQSLKEIEQAKHDLTIKDKYATLERTIKRLGIKI